MLANIYTKTVRDKWIAMLVGAASVAAMTLLGTLAYADLDDVLSDMIAGLPEAMLSVIGLTGESTTGSLVLGEMMNLIAPLVLAGLAIAMGTAAVAGEERDGTIAVLLGNPRSRTRLLLAKLGSMVTIVVGGALLILAGSSVAVSAGGSTTEGVDLPGVTVHLIALALFFGALALFLGAWSGNASAANGVATAVLLVSFLAAGLLPLVEGLSDLARIFPWYYFNGGRPLSAGVQWGHIGVLAVGTMVFVAGGLIGVNRRDLRSGEGERGVVERLLAHSRIAAIRARVEGTTQVSSVTAKAVGDNRLIMLIGVLTIFSVAVLVGPMFNGLSDVLDDLAAGFPEALLAMVGGADLSTPEGWYVAEIFSLMAPGAVIAVSVMMGARALAGEEHRRTMDLLLANPVRRRRIVLEKALAMVIAGLIVGLGTFAGTMLGSILGGLGLSPGNVAAASTLSVAVGLVFGTFALAGGAATGSKRAATYTGLGTALVAYAVNTFLPVSERLAGWARWSPFHYYEDHMPLLNGFDLLDFAVLVAMSGALVLVGVVTFERRDIRG